MSKATPPGWKKASAYSIERGRFSIAAYRCGGVLKFLLWGHGSSPIEKSESMDDLLKMADELDRTKIKEAA